MPTIFTCETVLLKFACACWQQAVKKGVEILAEQKCVEARYADAIIRNHQAFGPYMVIAPGIMLAHARSEEGVLKLGMSLITLNEPIPFGNQTNDPVAVVFTLAAPDSHSHLEILERLAALLMTQENIVNIVNADKVENVMEILGRYSL